MPNRDGTGPKGKGSMTGRRMGNCKNSIPRNMPRGIGLGRRNRYGRNGGNRWED